MKRNRTIQLLAIAGVLAAALEASAAQVYKGKFNLPMKAQWGDVTLAPGDYTISQLQGGIPNTFSLEGKGKTVTVLAGNPDRNGGAGRGQLTIVDVNGKHVVRQFAAGALGATFPVPLSKKLRD